MFKFIKKDNYNETKLVYTTDEHGWHDILVSFLYFLKGCGFFITKSALEESIESFYSNGCLSEEIEVKIPDPIDLDTKILAEQAKYDHQYTKLKEMEFQIELESLKLIKEKCKKLNVSKDAVISTILQEYIKKEELDKNEP